MSAQIQGQVSPSARRFLARKLLRGAVVLGLAGGSIFGFVSTAVATSSASQSASSEFEYVTVSAGQTLWGLAESLAPNSNPQDWMQEVVNLNNLSSTDLTPGQRIAVPQ
jgi:LysM repeat protein